MIRLYQGLTQKQYAKLLNISIATVAMIETGERRVSDNVRSKIAKRFKLDADFYEYVSRTQTLKSI